MTSGPIQREWVPGWEAAFVSDDALALPGWGSVPWQPGYPGQPDIEMPCHRWTRSFASRPYERFAFVRE